MSKYNLTFSSLRTANVLRLPQFKTAKGAPAHSQPDGSDWPLDGWSNAALGELGEAANIIKKLRRGEYTLDDRPAAFGGATVREALAKELADTVCYIDLLAYQIRVSLGDAVAEKFNEISRRVGATITITPPFRVDGALGGVYVQAVAVDDKAMAATEGVIDSPLGEPAHENDPLIWARPRVQGCPSMECQIRNRCTGSAGCMAELQAVRPPESTVVRAPDPRIGIGSDGEYTTDGERW